MEKKQIDLSKVKLAAAKYGKASKPEPDMRKVSHALEWLSGESDRKLANKKKLEHSDLACFGVSDEHQQAQFRIVRDEKRRAKLGLKEQRERIAYGKAKDLRTKRAKNAFYNGKSRHSRIAYCEFFYGGKRFFVETDEEFDSPPKAQAKVERKFRGFLRKFKRDISEFKITCVRRKILTEYNGECGVFLVRIIDPCQAEDYQQDGERMLPHKPVPRMIPGETYQERNGFKSAYNKH